MHQRGVSRPLHSRGTFNLHFQLPVSYDVERLHLQMYPGLWSKPSLTKTQTRAQLKGKISKCFFCRVDAQSRSASSKRDQASVFHGSFLATHLVAWKAMCIVCFLAAGHPQSWFWVGWWVESPRFRQGAEWLFGGEIKSFRFYFLWAESVLGLSHMVQEQPLSVISVLVTVNFTYIA